MKAIDRAVDTADGLQRRWLWLAFPVAVWKKFQDDQAGSLAALISYYGFAATFPLLLVLVTVLNITLKNNPALHQDLLNSALAQYPVIGQQISSNLHSLPETGVPLAIGIVFLLLAARGIAGAMQNALCEVWGLPEASRPGFPWSLLYGMALGYVVSHQLHRASSLYGVFGVVLGLLAWLYLQAEVTLYAAEVDVVLVRRLWPRSIKSDNGDRAGGDEKDERADTKT